MSVQTSITHAQVRAVHARAYAQVRKPWGGLTIDLSNAQTVPAGADAYAVSLRPAGMASVSIPETATLAEFAHAFNVALTRYGVSPYLGIWHDDEHHVIEFDPVDVVATTAEVDALGAIYPVAGGAYHFATGNGYWPNGKTAQAAWQATS